MIFLKESPIINMVESVKTAVFMVLTTVSASLGMALEAIPRGALTNAGLLAGVILSITLIVIHIKKYNVHLQQAKLEREQFELENKLLRARLDKEGIE